MANIYINLESPFTELFFRFFSFVIGNRHATVVFANRLAKALVAGSTSTQLDVLLGSVSLELIARCELSNWPLFNWVVDGNHVVQESLFVFLKLEELNEDVKKFTSTLFINFFQKINRPSGKSLSQHLPFKLNNRKILTNFSSRRNSSSQT